MQRDSEFLTSHIRDVMNFYHPVVIDRKFGGYINQLRDDGSIYDRMTKHLVGTCRFIYNYSVAARVTGDETYREAAEHGLIFLREGHRQPDGSYAWVLQGREVEDATRHCYGHAFVLLAAAAACQSGIPSARTLIEEVNDLLETRFYQPAAGLYVDVINADRWDGIDPYRGQNANMHMCEAMLAAHAATGDRHFLHRARDLARKVCVDLAALAGGSVWEHYTADWKPDWDYNKHDPKNLFRPHGFLPGHLVEWAKLLVMLDRARSEQWMVELAVKFFADAVDKAWDHANGGMHYAFGRDGTILDSDRYYWVLAEAIAAAALLGAQTGDAVYWLWYDRFWDYADKYLIDHRYGGWYRVVDIDGRRHSDLKSPPAKTDYHPLSACYIAMEALGTA